ncbi:hypothetical protein ACRCPS_18355 [Pseudomonas aeruginosa]
MNFADVKVSDLKLIQPGYYGYGSYIVQISSAGKATVIFHGGAHD